MRLFSMTIPVPATSRGEAFDQGLARSGLRVVAKTRTTEFSTALPAGAGNAVRGAIVGSESAANSWAAGKPARVKPSKTNSRVGRGIGEKRKEGVDLTYKPTHTDFIRNLHRFRARAT